MDFKNELQTSLESAWQEEDSAYINLLALKEKPPEDIYGNLWQEAFSKTPKVVVCMDERVSLNNTNVPEIGIAGTLVLMEGEDFEKTIVKLKVAGVEMVTYHEGCGAAALYKAKNNDPREISVISRSAAERTCSALGLSSKIGFCGYNNADLEMRGNPRFHNARAIVVDGSGRFNPPLLGFPAHFLLSAFYEPSLEYTGAELEVALQIALGEHGFGKERFAQQPLAIVLVSGDGEYSIDNLLMSFSLILKKYKNYLTLITLRASNDTLAPISQFKAEMKNEN